MSEQCLIAEYYGSATFFFIKIINNYENWLFLALQVHNFHVCGCNCVGLACSDASNYSFFTYFAPKTLGKDKSGAP
jgi:hypothetical protein